MSVTLRDRAAEYFGRGNANRMRYVSLGRSKCAFVRSTQILIYQEHPGGRRDGLVVNLSDKMRSELIDAMEGF